MGINRDHDQYLTPRLIAERLAIKVDKVLDWIHTGQLEAINVARNPRGKRPRWRISHEALKRFEATRSNRRNIAPQPTPRQRRSATVHQYV